MATIIIVEDNQTVGRLLSRLLRKEAGVQQAVVVDSAEAALAELARRQGDETPFPTLALVDVSLPAMSGIELVAALQEQYPALRCLMISGHSDDSYVRRSLAAGAIGYLTKDNPLELVERVRQALALEKGPGEAEEASA